MTIDIQSNDAVTVIRLEGDALGGPDGRQLHDVLRELPSEERKCVVADLEGIRLMNSSGLGMLIGAHTTVRNGGGELVLAGPGERVEGLLEITRLDQVFRVFESVEEAVEELGTRL